MSRDVGELQRREIAAWDQFREAEQRTERAWLDNLSSKFSELPWLLPKLRVHEREFEDARCVLELGAGEGWASCVVKRLHPTVRVVASDLSETAISATGKWERIFESTVDVRLVCPSDSVPLPDDSVDLIFCFQAAHHFVLQTETLREAARLLRPGGVCLYLHEPSCRRYVYRLAKWRVTRKRPEAPEDVLVVEDLLEASASLGFTSQLAYSTTTYHRGVVEGLYYRCLSIAPSLCRWLPCTADFIFRLPS